MLMTAATARVANVVAYVPSKQLQVACAQMKQSQWPCGDHGSIERFGLYTVKL